MQNASQLNTRKGNLPIGSTQADGNALTQANGLTPDSTCSLSSLTRLHWTFHQFIASTFGQRVYNLDNLKMFTEKAKHMGIRMT